MTIKWILKQILGVEFNRKNLNLTAGAIASCVIVIVITYIILVPFDFFSIIENMVKLSKQPWYAEGLAKYSFLMVTVKVFFLSLFTKKNNILGRFKAAFTTQLIGFVGAVVIHTILNNFINTSTSIDSNTKFIYGLLPFAVNLVIFATIQRIYKDENFDDRKFFGNK